MALVEKERLVLNVCDWDKVLSFFFGIKGVVQGQGM